MSGYRSYASWSKGGIPSYSSKKDNTSTPKYESSYARSRPEAKKTEDKSATSALGGKYSAYSSGYQRDSAVHSPSALSTRSELSRYKAPIDKKDTNHPPITYRPLTRTTMSRSRDPSPVDKDKTESSSSGSYNHNRLYPKSYTGSGSRERTDSISSSTTIPKYTGRPSLSKEDSKYPLGRSSREVSKEDLTSNNRYKPTTTTTRTPSREDLSKSSQKYINSRFLPKNSVEKSYTAYTRPSASRSSEVSRKNRELLNVLSAQNEDKSRPVSRCSSIAAEEFKERQRPDLPKFEFDPYPELESITVVTRSTSPNPPSQTSVVRTRRVDNARLIEKQISRLKKRPPMIDKEVQSDRLDDSTKNSRFAGASRIAAPWSSYLDLKYSSPGEAKSKAINSEDYSSQNEVEDKIPRSREPESPKSISRNSSSKSLSYSSTKSEIPKESKLRAPSNTQSDKPKSKLTPPKSIQSDKKLLPPQVPKSESSKSFNPLNTPNKDFRKSVLNMNTDGKLKKKNTKRSNSVSSADSDGATSEATEASENLSSCKSFSRSSSIPKIPQKVSQESTNDQRSRRSFTRSPSLTSESSSAAASSSEDDGKSKLMKPVSKLKKLAAKTSMLITSNDEFATDRSPKPPLSPRIKIDGPKTEADAKSFLMRALAPVTNLFKAKHDSSEKINWMEDSSENISEIKTESSLSHSKNLPDVRQNIKSEETQHKNSREDDTYAEMWFDDSQFEQSEAIDNSKSEELRPKRVLYRMGSGEREWWLGEDGSDNNRSEETKSPKRILCRSESGEKAWWLEDATDERSRESTKSNSSRKHPIKIIKHVDSGEKAWWLDENSDIPEGIQIYPVTSMTEDGMTEGGGITFKVKKDDSGDKSLWLEEATVDNNRHSSKSNGSQKYPIKIVHHVDFDEKPWWLDENSETPEGVRVYKIQNDGDGGNPSWVEQNGNDETAKNDSVEPECFEKLKIRHIDSGERAWWLSSQENIPEGVQKWEAQENQNDANKTQYKLCNQKSGDVSWWHENDIPHNMRKPDDEDETEDESECDIPLGDRASPEGLETPREEEARRKSPYDNVPNQNVSKRPSHINLFISKHTNIDDILGGSGQLLSPLMNKIFSYQSKKCGDRDKCEEINAEQVKIHDNLAQRGVIQPRPLDVIGGFPKTASHGKGTLTMSLICRVQYLNDIDPFSYTTNFPDPPRPPLHTFSVALPLINQLAAVHRLLKSPHRLDDAALQLYKDGDYGSYLDLEASISEQQEEFEGFQSNKKNSIVLRTQLSVRVHTIIEKLLTSEGRELRRALFSLKQIFQEDKDLVHEFVQNDGLACLIKVGSEADQNYQNYILRALGQVMLYVDGMNGVMEHNQTIQWLYTLISSKFRLVVKTALKLLLVFVEYKDTNCMLLIKAVHAVDSNHSLLPWHNIMKLLKDFDSADTELLIYATTLINKCLNGIPDQDTYYDQTDALEEQGIEAIIQRYMSKPGTDLDLLQQFQIYEAVLQYEDGEDKGTPIRHLDESIRKTLRSRKSLVESSERRKSRRHSTGNTPVHSALNNNSRILNQTNEEDDDESSSSQSSEVNNPNISGSYKESNKAIDAGVTPALRRRRERAERQRSFMKEQAENGSILRGSVTPTDENIENGNGNYTNGLQQRLTNGNNILSRNCSRKDLTPLLNAVNKIDSEENNGHTKQPWILSMMYGKTHEEENREHVEDTETANENDRNLLLQLKKENTVKDLTQKLANQNIIHSPSDESKVNRIGDMSGLISKAKEGLAKSKSQANVVKSPTGENVPKMVEVKKSENELRWEELASNLNRPLNLCDMDFTDLASDDENDVLAPAAIQNGIPPPPPPLLNDLGVAPPPPPLANRMPPPVPNPPIFNVNLQRINKPSESKIPAKKTKKTVKLFWKEVRDDPIGNIKLKSGFIWDELNPVCVDTQKLEHLFESRAKDLISKKQQELNKNKEIIVLDPKRSNAINIGMTKLPPPRSIKTAILKMDATIMNREGIEKLLTMLPTEEERTKIQEAQAANPDLPLGSAEQFLLTLASISELPARLKLWAFKLDFENTEREIAEPLMDLKQGFEVLRVNKTFRGILSTLLSIGNFLNGNEVKGFQIEYLSKVPEVKDTVHKHSLLHHLCHIVMEKFPDATDLYSEIGAITRASKVDFDELSLNIQRLESDCKASWDHLKLIAKHDGSTMMKIKMSDFLADCAERIILLSIIHRRVLNRFHKFLLWLGIPIHQIGDTKPNEFCRVISEFALEYRTTRERVLQQLEKKANHRERNKTRGKMITESGKFCTKEDRADAELRQLLGSDISDIDSMQGTLSWRRPRRGDVIRSSMGQVNGNLTDGDDEILESLVKTATKGPSSRTAPRERKRTRHADRKSLKRSRTRENNPFGSRDSP